MSIKNNIATSVVYIQWEHEIIKTVYHTINILLTETKLFAIRCDISWATQL